MSRGPSHITHNLGDITKNIAKNSGVNAKISIQKLYAYWEDIIGKDNAGRAIPYHISWGKAKKQRSGFAPMNMQPMGNNNAFNTKPKSKNSNKSEAPTKEKATATLHIAASSAIATKLMYQEALILERIQRVIGSDSIKAITVKHESGLENISTGYKVPRKLNKGENQYLDDTLDFVEDEHIKKLLKSLGEKILLDNDS